MGGYGAPLPGRGFPRQGPQGGVYGQPNDLVSSRTPVANQIVEGINSFVGGFRDAKEGEKQSARQRFLEGIQMMQLGLPVDRKKMARDARTAGFNFDYEGQTPMEKQQAQQAPPMPGGGMGGGMPGGGPMGGMPQGGAPMPGGGGGKGFFGRLGAAVSDPFREQPPIPGNAGVHQAMDKMQQQGQAGMEKEMLAAQIVKTMTTEKPGSDKWMQAAQLGEMLGVTKGIPELLKDDIKTKQLADALKTTPEKVKASGWAVEMTKLTASLAGKVDAENLPKIMQSVAAAEVPDAGLFAVNDAEAIVDPGDSYKFWRSKLPDSPPSMWSAATAFELAGDYDSLGTLLEQFPSTDIREQERAAKGDKRADSAEARAARGEGRAAAAEGRAEEREVEKQDYAARQRNAAYYYARAGGSLKEAIRMLREDAKINRWLSDDLLDIEAIMAQKASGFGSMSPGSAAAEGLPKDQF